MSVYIKGWSKHNQDTVYNTKYYVVIDLVGGPDWKIFGSRSGCTDQAQRGPCVLTYSQIFFCLAQPHSVNKNFII